MHGPEAGLQGAELVLVTDHAIDRPTIVLICDSREIGRYFPGPLLFPFLRVRGINATLPGDSKGEL